MNRRLFIERIAALVGLGIAVPPVQASGLRRIELHRSPVAGFQYHQGEAVWLSRQSSSGRKGSGLGFWGTVGAFVLGWGIGDALFGDDD